MVHGVSTKLAKIERARQRFEGMLAAAQAHSAQTHQQQQQQQQHQQQQQQQQQYDAGHVPSTPPPKLHWDNDPYLMSPLAAELPADIPQDWNDHPQQLQLQYQPQDVANKPPSSAGRQSYDSGPDSFSAGHRRSPSPVYPNSARVSASSHTQSIAPSSPQHHQHRLSMPPAPDGVTGAPSLAMVMAQRQQQQQQQQQQPPPGDDSFIVTAPTPSQYHVASGSDKILITNSDEMPRIITKHPTRCCHHNSTTTSSNISIRTVSSRLRFRPRRRCQSYSRAVWMDSMDGVWGVGLRWCRRIRWQKTSRHQQSIWR